MPPPAPACCSVIELRQYTLHPGQRDVLIPLFDTHFVESQEAVGMHIVGQFRDEERPDTGLAHPGPPRPPLGTEARPASRVELTLCYLKAPADEGFTAFFEQRVRPVLAQTGAQPRGLFQTEPAPNTFPALPVRTGEHVFAWLTVLPRAGAKAWAEQVLPDLDAWCDRPLEHLTLSPTSRSQLR